MMAQAYETVKRRGYKKAGTGRVGQGELHTPLAAVVVPMARWILCRVSAIRSSLRSLPRAALGISEQSGNVGDHEKNASLRMGSPATTLTMNTPTVFRFNSDAWLLILEWLERCHIDQSPFRKARNVVAVHHTITMSQTNFQCLRSFFNS